MASRKDTTAKARLVHQHILRLKTYLLRGRGPEQLWKGLPKEPTLPQMRALTALFFTGPCQMKTFAQTLDISMASASEMIERLVQMKLVVRRQHEMDRRQVILTLSKSAEKRMHGHEEYILLKLNRIMEQLTKQDSDRWVELAININKAIDRLDNNTESGHKKRRK